MTFPLMRTRVTAISQLPVRLEKLARLVLELCWSDECFGMAISSSRAVGHFVGGVNDTSVA